MMNNRPLRSKNPTALHTAGFFLLFAAQWLISVLLVRLGGYYDAGIFSLAMTISNVFAFIANFGIRSYLLTDVHGKYSPRQYRGARLLSAGIAVLLCVGYALIVNSFSATERFAILLYLSYTIFNTISEVYFGRLQLAGKLEINAYSNMLRGVVCFASFLVSYLIRKSIILSIAAMALSAAAVTLLYDQKQYQSYTNDREGIPVKDYVVGLRLLADCLPIMLTLVLPLVTTAIPRQEIQNQLGTELLGYFSSIFTPTVLISVTVPAVLQAILPSISANWENRMLKRLRRQLISCIFGIILFVCLALIVARGAGAVVLNLVFGKEILRFFPLLYWAIAVTGLNALVALGNQFLLAMHKHKLLLAATCLAVCLCAVVSRSFIEKWQLYGATYALAIAYGVQLCLQGAVIVWTMRRKGEPQ